LTVMSYSMIDTIVVFDRIRENRGKFRHMSRKIVNDSIQPDAFSHLIDGRTNIVTVAGMYFVGDRVSTALTLSFHWHISWKYSSIAIAAPIFAGGFRGEKRRRAKSSQRRLESITR